MERMTREQIADEWNLDLSDAHTLLFVCAEYWRRRAEYWKARATGAGVRQDSEITSGPNEH
jgi:hypothetical protein